MDVLAACPDNPRRPPLMERVPNRQPRGASPFAGLLQPIQRLDQLIGQWRIQHVRRPSRIQREFQ